MARLETGVVQGVIRYYPLHFLLGTKMRLSELFEAKVNKKVVKSPTPRNFVAKNAPKSGAGSHASKKYDRKEKHKKPDSDD